MQLQMSPFFSIIEGVGWPCLTWIMMVIIMMVIKMVMMMMMMMLIKMMMKTWMQLTVTLARVVVVLAEEDWEGVEAWDHPTCQSR